MEAMEGRKVRDSIDFLDNTIFREGAYFVDFENQKLEVWKAGRVINDVDF